MRGRKILRKGKEMKHKKILLLPLLIIFICNGISSQRDVKSYPLKGINAIFVLIEKLPEDAIEIGLTEDRLRTITELRLRKEGIKIEEDGNIPYLYINVNIVEVAFNVILSINEWTTLSRNPSIECYAVTWQSFYTGTHTNKPEYIVSSISNLLDEFLNDWYKANPKK